MKPIVVDYYYCRVVNKYYLRELYQTAHCITANRALCGASEAGQEMPSNGGIHEVRW